MASDEEPYSDLTELESEDEYDTGSKKKGKKTTHAPGWRIRNALKVPRATTYTAQALYDQIYGCDINLEPEYQRDVVWTETKQIGIIDSVFRNFYIPPVIFAVNVQDDGSETKTCIDGKQRLTSIYKFMEGLIPHKDPVTNEKLWYKDISTGSGRKRKLLPEKYRRLFANKQIVCVEYQDITDADEREIFQRVQLGMALTPAEKLQVVKTPRTDFVRDLQNEYCKEDGWLGPKHLAWDVSRGSDFRGLANAVYCMDTWTNLTAGAVGMQQLERWLSVDRELPRDTRADVEDSFRLFAEMVKDKKLNKVFQTSAKLSPVEFNGVATLIFAHKDKASLQQLAAGIAEMRQHMRKIHVDVRQNTRVTSTMLEFIRAWDPQKSTADIASLPTTKRKRGANKAADDDEDAKMDDADEDDDDADYAPKTKKKNTGKAAANAEASTSATIPPIEVKTEPRNSPVAPGDTVTAPTPRQPPPTDRMAAMRAAQAKVAQAQAERAKHALPTGPRGLRGDNNNPHNPQMLPSPSQSYALPDQIAAAFNQNQMAGPPPGSAGSVTSGSSYRNEHGGPVRREHAALPQRPR